MSRISRRLAVIMLLVLCGYTGSSAQTEIASGRLSLVWGDARDESGAAELFVLLFTGQATPLRLAFPEGAQPPYDELQRMNGQMVTVSGSVAQTSRAAAGSAGSSSALLVQHLDWVQPVGDIVSGSLLSGSQPWVTLRCRFGDSPMTDRDINTDLITGTGFPTLDEFWRETSYNNINLSGSIATPWVTMANPRSYYIYDNNGDGQEDANLARLVADCTAAADSQVNFTNFVGINMFFNQSIGGFWWGGGYNLTLDGQSRVWRSTWIGIGSGFSGFLAGLAHENGHGFGFPHSSGPYGEVYDSRWDVMSNSYIRYDGGLSDYIPQGTIAYHKDLDGWIPANRRFVALHNTSTTISLERLVTPIASSNYLVAFIPVPGLSTRFYTVEMRQTVGHDLPLPGTAVVIHDVVPNRSNDSPALVVDPDNNHDPNDAGAMWTTGETFTDAVNKISVTVVSLNATSATVTITSGNPLRRLTQGDFDGDGRSDISVFRPSSGTWFVRYAASGAGTSLVWGGGSDRPVTGDYDGDGTADMAIFRPATGTWYIRHTATGTGPAFVWGDATVIPVPGDYDGDGMTDAAVFHPASGTWGLRYTAGGSIAPVWGGATDIPAQGDYDGDGLTDIAIFRPTDGTWFIRYSATGAGISLVWGGGSDTPLPGDYDGDGKTDIAVFRPSTGTWYVRYTATGSGPSLVWGGGSDIPVPGDFTGDGKTDLAVFRPSTGTWYVRDSSNGALVSTVWGASEDIPIFKRP